MTDAARAIANLLYIYAERIDAGDLAGAAALFADGAIVSQGRRIAGMEAIAAEWARWMRLYDGRPRTRHLVTNPIIELGDDGATATCRSQYTVLQASDGFALQPVISGRYHDRFSRTGDTWHFAEREYADIDLVGDLSAHLLQPLNED